MLITVAVLAANFLVDLTYGLIDPRIRTAGGGRVIRKLFRNGRFSCVFRTARPYHRDGGAGATSRRP